jgi:antitoxin component of MazEF toxin-antitoxin module
MAETHLRRNGGSWFIRVPAELMDRFPFFEGEILVMTVSRLDTVTIKRKRVNV